MESKKWSKPLENKKKYHPKIVLTTIKERGNANSKQMTGRQIEIEIETLSKCKLKKYWKRWLDGWSTNFITQLNRIVGLHLLQPLHPHPKINILMGFKKMDNLTCIRTWKNQGWSSCKLQHQIITWHLL
jgi:hypothetical protein